MGWNKKEEIKTTCTVQQWEKRQYNFMEDKGYQNNAL